MQPTRDETYMEVCNVFAKRSTCQRGQVGAVLVRDRRIISTGYNGAPPGAPDCLEMGCLVQEGAELLGCQRSIHAEANVVAYAARHQGGAQGSSLYCTHGPCLKCAQLILSAGIKVVTFAIPYRLTDGVELLESTDVVVRQLA